VIKIDPRDENVTFELYFNDFKTLKSTVIKEPDALAAALLSEIRRKLKAKYETSDEDDILSGIVMIIIESEDSVEQKLSMFLAKVGDKAKELKNASQGTNYMSLLQEVQTMKLVFE